MFKSVALNTALVTLTSIFLGYVGLFFTVPMETLIIILNGAFVGTMASISVAFYPLIRDAIRMPEDFGRVQQLSLGIMILVVAICVLAFNSIYFRSMGVDLPTTPVTALGRYLSICGMVMMITAPDYDEGFFFSRDRRLLWSSLLIGVVFALVVILMQTEG